MLRLIKVGCGSVIDTFSTTAEIGDYLLKAGGVVSKKDRANAVNVMGKILSGKNKTFLKGKYTVDEQSISDYKFTPEEELVGIFDELVTAEIEFLIDEDVGKGYSYSQFFDSKGIISDKWRNSLLKNKLRENIDLPMHEGENQDVSDIIDHSRKYLITRKFFEGEFKKKNVGDKTVYKIANPFSGTSFFSFAVDTHLIPVESNCFELDYSKEWNTLTFVPVRRGCGKPYSFVSNGIILADNPNNISPSSLMVEIENLKDRILKLEDRATVLEKKVEDKDKKITEQAVKIALLEKELEQLKEGK